MSGESAQPLALRPPRSNPRLSSALDSAVKALTGELEPHGHWIGELSSSALSTATAVAALAIVDPQAHGALIEDGLRWLADHQNADGGWGDTTASKSNISTTALAWSAFGAAGKDAPYRSALTHAERWLGIDETRGPKLLISAIKDRYGKDRTFSVPILMTLALGGRLGLDGWREVLALPFELAALPHQIFGALRLPVVSYALPALIAIGQARHHHAPSANPVLFVIRERTRLRTLQVLERIQPSNGGFLEATPLTSFVTMAIASMGLREERVVRRGVEFLRSSVRADGSWPIDTNLATWLTTLALKALRHGPQALSPAARAEVRRWLLAQQYRDEHSYTHAVPGGWAWTDLPGGVPDADDTAGALLALLECGAMDRELREAGTAGVRWLLGLQNRDGGIPTFCRGWGALPFDRSGADLTAHALRAWAAWREHLTPDFQSRIDRATRRALAFLQKTQRPDGAWLPLWFGNEHAPREENPTYGTAQVLIALRALSEHRVVIPPSMAERAVQRLLATQTAEGGWGGSRGMPPSIEETGLALEALAGISHEAVARGAAWLAARIEDGTWREPAPIGFYFAKLWYSERLYPLIFAVGGLAAAHHAPAESA